MRKYAALVALIVSGPAVAAETTDAATVYARDDCIERTATLTRFTDNAGVAQASFAYQEVDSCQGIFIRAGSGAIPLVNIAGGWRSGVMSVNVNVAAVPGYTYAGPAYTGRIRWTRTDARVVRRDSGEIVVENFVQTGQWRRTEIEQTAVVSGVNNLVGAGPGAFAFTLLAPQ